MVRGRERAGTRGALFVAKDGTVTRQSARTVKAVDTTGAGDCFTAAWAVATVEGKDPKDAMAFACTAASICVQAKGAMPSLPSRATVDRTSW